MPPTEKSSKKSKRKVNRPTQIGRYRAGRQQIPVVLTASKAVLVNGGYAQLTLRRVAAEAHMSLALLQHYFKTKRDLLRAVVEEICRDYIEQCDLLVARAQGSPEAKFLTCIDYLIEDNRDPISNTLFFELWALACHDEHANLLLDELLTYYRKYIADLIRNMKPGLSEHRIEHRAVQIVALLEGLTLFISRDKPSHAAMRGLTADTRANILSFATRAS